MLDIRRHDIVRIELVRLSLSLHVICFRDLVLIVRAADGKFLKERAEQRGVGIVLRRVGEVL